MEIKDATPYEINEAINKAAELNNVLGNITRTIEHLRSEKSILALHMGGHHTHFPLQIVPMREGLERNETLEKIVRPYLLGKFEKLEVEIREEIKNLFAGGTEA